jgi:hypothetical protein
MERKVVAAALSVFGRTGIGALPHMVGVGARRVARDTLLETALRDAASENGVGGGRPADVPGADEQKTNGLFLHGTGNDKMNTGF